MTGGVESTRKLPVLGLVLALMASAANAGFCERDAVPAATLLVPYAVVGLDSQSVPDPNQYATILDVTNLSSQKQIIHVVVWDCLGDAVIDVDEVLSGYDVWQINFRDMLTGSFNLFDTGDLDGMDNGNGPKPASIPTYPQGGNTDGVGCPGAATARFDEAPLNDNVGRATSREQLGDSGKGLDPGSPASVGKNSGATPASNPPYPEIGDFWRGTLGTTTSPWTDAFVTGYPTQWGPSSNSIFTSSAYPPGGPAPQLPRPQDVDYPVPANTGCNFPYGPLPGIGATIVSLLQAAIIPGLVQDASDCVTATVASPDWLVSTQDNPVFFWVTVDDVTGCNQDFPNDPGYWGPTLFPTVHNVLAGNVFYLSPAGNYSESVPAVSIEADLDWASPTPHAGFYSQYTENFTAPVHDFHEPLPTAFAFEYYNGSGITSNLTVWKNTSELELCKGVSCAWNACLPLIYYAWDQNENSRARGGCGGGASPNPLPIWTQRVPLTPTNFEGLPAASGWMLLVFDPSILGTTYGAGHGPLGNLSRDTQAWVGVQYYWGTYSTSVEATTVGNFWCFPGDVMPNLGTYDGVLDGSLKR